MLCYLTMPNKITPIYLTKRTIMSSRQLLYRSIIDRIIVLDKLFMLCNEILSLKTRDNIAYVWKKNKATQLSGAKRYRMTLKPTLDWFIRIPE